MYEARHCVSSIQWNCQKDNLTAAMLHNIRFGGHSRTRIYQLGDKLVTNREMILE